MSPITVLLIVLFPLVAGFAGVASDRRGTNEFIVGAIIGFVIAVVYNWFGLFQLVLTAFALSMIGATVARWLPSNNAAKKFLNVTRFFR